MSFRIKEFYLWRNAKNSEILSKGFLATLSSAILEFLRSYLWYNNDFLLRAHEPYCSPNVPQKHIVAGRGLGTNTDSASFVTAGAKRNLIFFSFRKKLGWVGRDPPKGLSRRKNHPWIDTHLFFPFVKPHPTTKFPSDAPRFRWKNRWGREKHESVFEQGSFFVFRANSATEHA